LIGNRDDSLRTVEDGVLEVSDKKEVDRLLNLNSLSDLVVLNTGYL